MAVKRNTANFEVTSGRQPSSARRFWGRSWVLRSRVNLLISCVLIGIGGYLYFADKVAFGDMTARDAHTAVEAGQLVLIDVREPYEWRKTGIAKGAYAIASKQNKAQFLAKVLAAVEGDKMRPIAFICARGVRSKRMQNLAKSHGFTEVHSVRDGMSGFFLEPGWVKEKLPVRPWRGVQDNLPMSPVPSAGGGKL